MKTLLIHLALKLSGALSLPATRRLGTAIASVMRLFKNDVHRTSRININIVYPELSAEQSEALVQKSVTSTIVNSLEMPLIWQKDQQWLDQKIRAVRGEDILCAAIARGKGVILVSPHVGNWEVIGRFVPRYGAVTSLYQPPKYPELENIVKSGREKSNSTLVPTNQRGIATLLKALRKKQMIGILPDQVPKPGSGDYAMFYNRPAYTMTLIHSMVQKTNASVVLSYALRSGSGSDSGFDIIFKQAPDELYAKEQDISLNALNQMVCMAIEDDPAQYQWAYKRFKRQPEQWANPYRRFRNKKRRKKRAA